MRLLRDGLPGCRHGLTTAGAVLDKLRHLPMAGLDAIVGQAPVLVLAPHADDESLGCGGLIAACVARGQSVQVLVLTDGTGSHPNSREYPPPRLSALRQEETRAAVAALGLGPERVDFLGLRDTAAPHHGPTAWRAAARIADRARACGAGSIVTTWRHDPHTDHLAASRLGRAAARAVGARLLQYPVWGWTLPAAWWLPNRPLPGFRLDISAVLPAKRAAIACHRSQTSALIDDDPGGFRLLDDVLANFAGPVETFLVD